MLAVWLPAPMNQSFLKSRSAVCSFVTTNMNEAQSICKTELLRLIMNNSLGVTCTGLNVKSWAIFKGGLKR